jgi:hypothetical protein
MLPKRRAHMGLEGHEAGHVEVDTFDWGKPEHSDQTRGTTVSHIGVRAESNIPETSGTPGHFRAEAEYEWQRELFA